VVGDETARSEREDHRDGAGERRRDQRQDGRGVEQPRRAARQAGPDGGVGEDEAEHGAEQTDQRGQQQAVAERAPLLGLAEDRRHVTEGEAALLAHEDLHEQHAEREDDEQCERRPENQQRARQRRIAPDAPGDQGFAISFTQRSTMRLRLAPA
jgi:hypothetical protein